jgi:hypothetical protein
MTVYQNDGNIFELAHFGAGWNNALDDFHKMREGKSDEWFMLNDSDLELVKKLVATESKRFEKRLHAYLKRYGLSKIKSWTYWLDA